MGDDPYYTRHLLNLVRIQIASLLGYLGSETYSIYPFLVVVPNSTITNWVREFEKWVPHMRVVSAVGSAVWP